MHDKHDQSAEPGSKKRFSLLRRFRKDKRGSVAVEFSMLILPFTLMVFAIIETGLSFAADQVISNVGDDIARDYRTGVLKPDTKTEVQIFNQVCDRIEILVAKDCPELVIDFKQYDDFSDVPTTITYTAEGDIDTAGFDFDPGGSETINTMRIFYRWPIITDFMRSRLSNLPGGKTLLFTSITWRNEPYL